MGIPNMIRVNANLFRIAAMCMSSEKTRYYLQGVFVEPHERMGATLTATDGRYLLSIHDDTAVCDTSAIVKLSPDALRACKPAKNDPSYVTRMVSIGDADKRAFVVLESGEPPFTEVAVSPDCFVDGAFPAWRDVVTSAMKAPEDRETPPAFDGAVLGKLCDVASAFGSDKGLLVVTGATTGGPALVTFPHTPHAFGLIMPFRKPDCFEAKLPWWFQPKAPALKAA